MSRGMEKERCEVDLGETLLGDVLAMMMTSHLLRDNITLED
jgi:hypothetical protein